VNETPKSTSPEDTIHVLRPDPFVEFDGRVSAVEEGVAPEEAGAYDSAISIRNERRLSGGPRMMEGS
jgi:hypothetical protein